MQITATGKGPSGNLLRTKIRFFNIAKNSFEWESQISGDGTTWSKTASLLASRAGQ